MTIPTDPAAIAPWAGDRTQLLAQFGVTEPEELPDASRWSLAPTTPLERRPPTLASAEDLVKRFRHFREAHGVILDEQTAVDCLAAYLATQFILFAGPSGTGKSTVAALLQRFFAPSDMRAVLHGRRQLVGPEDVTGFYSPLGVGFVEGSDLSEIERTANKNGDAASPSILVEEINLSPPEGYLSPFIHGLSGLSTPEVRWRLFADRYAGAESRVAAVLTILPYPRLLGTINVDATAPAPAPKVSARACVVLLEPSPIGGYSDVAKALQKDVRAVSDDSPGARHAFDPLDVLKSPDARGRAAEEHVLRVAAVVERGAAALKTDVSATEPVRDVSRRQLEQMVLFVVWYDLLARAAGAGTDDSPLLQGAENAVLHFLLPSLNGQRFTNALGNLRAAMSGLTERTGDEQNSWGGALRARVRRLGEGQDEAGFSGRLMDFWDRLS